MWDTAIEEDARTRLRRRLQQRRCLVCGSRALVNRTTSYFCALHITTHRYCGPCETLRTAVEHGNDSRCRACATARSLAYYHANAERNLYRIRLRQLSTRTRSRADQIFDSLRRRIALADLVAQTPDWSWPRRAAVHGGDRAQLARAYREQCAGLAFDADSPDRLTRRRD